MSLCAPACPSPPYSRSRQLFLSSRPRAQSQDPEKIIDQYIKAQGGTKALSKIQTITIEGTFTNTADGKTGTYTFDTKLPNRYYSEFVLGDKNVIEAYNGKSAWHQTPAGEITTLLGEEGTQLEAAGQLLQFASRQRQEEQARRSRLSATPKSAAKTRCKSKSPRPLA